MCIRDSPHTAPTSTPTVILIAAQMSARVMEILEPYQIASNVDSPDAPAPSIHLRLKPNLSMAAEGVRCFALASRRFAYLS